MSMVLAIERKMRNLCLTCFVLASWPIKLLIILCYTEYSDSCIYRYFEDISYWYNLMKMRNINATTTTTMSDCYFNFDHSVVTETISFILHTLLPMSIYLRQFYAVSSHNGKIAMDTIRKFSIWKIIWMTLIKFMYILLLHRERFSTCKIMDLYRNSFGKLVLH